MDVGYFALHCGIVDQQEKDDDGDDKAPMRSYGETGGDQKAAEIQGVSGVGVGTTGG